MAGRTVVFVHGLWLHATSWSPWAEFFEAAGYSTLAPGWPGEAATVMECREHPERVAGIGVAQAVEQYAAAIRGLPEPPIVIGHSFGGLIVQQLVCRRLASAAVAIDPAQIKGVFALPPAQLRSGFPVLGNPANRKKAVSLTADQFRYGFGNAIPAEESDALHDRWTIPSPGRPLFEAAFANFSANSPVMVDVRNSDRGPLLMVSGTRDHTVPDAVTRGAYKLYRHSTAVTDLLQFDRGHSLTIDHGWPEIADAALDWLRAKGF